MQDIARHRYTRQTNFDLPDSRFKNVDIDGEMWRIYDNTNFSIQLGEACNADCQFCVAHLRYIDQNKIYSKPSIEDEPYLRRLQDVLRLTKPVNPSVSITGGEPTIFAILPEMLDVLDRADVRKRTMTSNGSQLMRRVEGTSDTILDRLGKYKLEHLNISRAHSDDERNRTIMKMGDDMIGQEQLRDIIAEAKTKNIRVRLSCALLKEGISTVDQMEDYLDWAAGIGCDNVIFRQLMAFDTNRAKGKIADYCTDQTVSLIDVWEELDRRKDFVLNHSLLGYYYYVEIRRRGSVDVASEMADLRLIDRQIDRFSARFNKPTAFEMVYHPNGNLCASWFEEHRVMSAYKPEGGVTVNNDVQPNKPHRKVCAPARNAAFV